MRSDQCVRCIRIKYDKKEYFSYDEFNFIHKKPVYQNENIFIFFYKEINKQTKKKEEKKSQK